MGVGWRQYQWYICYRASGKEVGIVADHLRAAAGEPFDPESLPELDEGESVEDRPCGLDEILSPGLEGSLDEDGTELDWAGVAFWP